MERPLNLYRIDRTPNERCIHDVYSSVKMYK